MNEEIIMLASSSFWAAGSWVLSFEKKIQNWKLEMGTSQQPEPKLGTGLQLEQDSEPELTPKLIVFFPFLTWVRHVTSFRKKIGVWNNNSTNFLTNNLG
jgi:hypothetical protein